jgi:hypothetical protein
MAGGSGWMEAGGQRAGEIGDETRVRTGELGRITRLGLGD